METVILILSILNYETHENSTRTQRMTKAECVLEVSDAVQHRARGTVVVGSCTPVSQFVGGAR